MSSEIAAAMPPSSTANVAAAASAFGRLEDNEMLYPFSAATYRDRWNRIMRALGVPRDSGFSPGGLRGGGAVACYMQDEGIMDIMWKMRIRDQQTLALGGGQDRVRR